MRYTFQRKRAVCVHQSLTHERTKGGLLTTALVIIIFQVVIHCSNSASRSDIFLRAFLPSIIRERFNKWQLLYLWNCSQKLDWAFLLYKYCIEYKRLSSPCKMKVYSPEFSNIINVFWLVRVQTSHFLFHWIKHSKVSEGLFVFRSIFNICHHRKVTISKSHRRSEFGNLPVVLDSLLRRDEHYKSEDTGRRPSGARVRRGRALQQWNMWIFPDRLSDICSVQLSVCDSKCGAECTLICVPLMVLVMSLEYELIRMAAMPFRAKVARGILRH